MKKVFIVGSINMDLVIASDRLPLMGETIHGRDFFTNPGGKGANQAVAVQKSGGDARFCACVGNAPQGKSALDWDAMQEELQASSEVLTAQLTNFAFYSGDILGSSAYPLEDRQIHLFILSTVMFMEEEKYLYHDFVTMDDEGCYHFPKEKIQQMAEEVFDIPDYEFGEDTYVPETGEYVFWSGFGWGNTPVCRNTEVQIDREKSEVSVSYELHGNVYYENPYKIGDFRTRFSVMTRPDGSFFLHYLDTVSL